MEMWYTTVVGKYTEYANIKKFNAEIYQNGSYVQLNLYLVYFGGI